MDLAPLVGLLGAFGIIIAAILFGGSAIIFVNIPSLLIVGGGTMFAVVMKFPLGHFFSAFKVAMKAFFSKPEDPVKLIEEGVLLANIARKEGVLGLEGQDIENEYLDLVRAIRASINIPIAIKLSPFFTNLPNFAQNLVEAGVNGLVLFNRFYQPDLDLEELEVVPSLVLSNSQEMRLPLRWIAILYGRIAADLALTSGIHTAEDLLKATMAGASASMVSSTLLKYGISHVKNILVGAQSWMVEHEYESIAQMKGSMSQQAVAEPAAFERANYIKVLSSFDMRFAP